MISRCWGIGPGYLVRASAGGALITHTSGEVGERPRHKTVGVLNSDSRNGTL